MKTLKRLVARLIGVRLFIIADGSCVAVEEPMETEPRPRAERVPPQRGVGSRQAVSP